MAMFTISYLDISAGLGLCAMGLLSLNFLLGMFLSTAYKTSALWKKMPPKIQQLSLFQLHNWTAYIALSLVALHPLFLVLDKDAGFGISAVFFPWDAPKQTWLVGLGLLSFYALLLVIITSQKPIRKRMGFRFWKNIHLVSYFTGSLFLIHGLLMDPLLKDRTPDWIDAEKLFCEICILILLVAGIIRYRYALSHPSKPYKPK
jgi:methionine sulfoxide reductase heme-binding subunit